MRFDGRGKAVPLVCAYAKMTCVFGFSTVGDGGCSTDFLMVDDCFLIKFRFALIFETSKFLKRV